MSSKRVLFSLDCYCCQIEGPMNLFGVENTYKLYEETWILECVSGIKSFNKSCTCYYGRNANSLQAGERMDHLMPLGGVFVIGDDRPLISVIAPTSFARHGFHPLLYECFCKQDRLHSKRQLKHFFGTMTPHPGFVFEACILQVLFYFVFRV